MKRFSISVWLSGLLIALFVPLFIFFLFLVGQLKISQDASLERRTLRTAETVSQSVYSVIENMSVTLNLVSSTKELADGDLQSFHAKTQYALQGTGNFVILATQDGRQLLNTRVDYGTNLGPVSDTDGMNAALANDGIHITGIFKGRTSDQWVFNVIKPVEPGNLSAARFVITTKNAQDLDVAFQNITLSEGWFISVVDAQGHVILSTKRAEQLPGDRIEDAVDEDFNQFYNDGQPRRWMKKGGVIYASSDVRRTAWKVLITGPVATAQASVYETWKILIIGSVIFAIVSALFFYLFSVYLRRSIKSISGMAKQLGTGEIVSPINSRISEIDIVAKALSDASFDRSQREDKITMVMRELAHRTKNLIAVVISMVRQTSRHAESTQAMTKSLTDRVMGLGFSIDLLTAREWGGVPLHALLEKQLSNFGSIGQNIILKGPEIELRAEAVQHLGMAIHELATNAAKHGSLSVSKGVVELTWHVDVDVKEDVPQFEITWRERGGPKVKAPKLKGFGSQILERFVAASLSGTSHFEYAKTGLVWQLTAPFDQIDTDKNIT